MTLRHLSSLIALACVLSACASHRESITTVPVGPPPSVARGSSPNGALVVFSALDIHGENPDVDQLHHSGYNIYSLNGKLLKRVYNQIGTHIGDPATVPLAPGKYKITAAAAAFGAVTVPIVIQPGKATFVHLDGSELSTGTQTATSRLVRLPDGLIIGWEAEEDSPSK